MCEETGRAQTMRLVAAEAVDEFFKAARVEPGTLRHLDDPDVDWVPTTASELDDRCRHLVKIFRQSRSALGLVACDGYTLPGDKQPVGGTMKRFMTTMSQSAEASKGLLQQGFANREAQLRERFESLGGTVDNYWVTSNGQTILVTTVPESLSFPLLAVRNMASGNFLEQATTVELSTGAEMDIALETAPLPTLPLPGSN